MPNSVSLSKREVSNAQHALELIEPHRPLRALPHNEKRPPFANLLQRACNGAIHISETFPILGEISGINEPKARYKRTKSPARNFALGASCSSRFAGALGQLFDRFPWLRTRVTKQFLGQNDDDEYVEARKSIANIHKEFFEELEPWPAARARASIRPA
ncbi:hypothetical protein [Cupriavidus pinatubonensis]|uniref:hypothetical protein n=1 Tax=Cupriavidus pinatubonensis TaxID=248026 RepID=UPI002159E321|nr:hypothetical protein [Cupriavidus pinatubonensis]